MAADLIIYGIVAAGLVLWLKKILGTRHGEERDRSSPYLSSDKETSEGGDNVIEIGGAAGKTAHDKIMDLADNPVRNISIENKTAENALLSIADADKSFDIHDFMSASQDAFVYIVEGFADGDREILGELLAQDVYAAFDSAIAARAAAGESMHAQIHAIKDAAVTHAALDGKMAYITVRFIASETTVTRNEKGDILSGNPDKTHEMRDLWVFGRDVSGRDPRWMVFETRDDLEDDNDIVPNSVSKRDAKPAEKKAAPKAAPKKAAVKKTAVKKPAAKKPAVKKATKPAAKKAATKSAATKKPAAKAKSSKKS